MGRSTPVSRKALRRVTVADGKVCTTKVILYETYYSEYTSERDEVTRDVHTVQTIRTNYKPGQTMETMRQLYCRLGFTEDNSV